MNLFYTITSEKPLEKGSKYWFDVHLDSNNKCQYEYFIEEGNLL